MYDYFFWGEGYFVLRIFIPVAASLKSCRDWMTGSINYFQMSIIMETNRMALPALSLEPHQVDLLP